MLTHLLRASHAGAGEINSSTSPVEEMLIYYRQTAQASGLKTTLTLSLMQCYEGNLPVWSEECLRTSKRYVSY